MGGANSVARKDAETHRNGEGGKRDGERKALSASRRAGPLPCYARAS